MALPSQYVGGARTRSHMYRRARRRGARRLVGLVGALAVVVAVVWWLRPDTDPSRPTAPAGAPADLAADDASPPRGDRAASPLASNASDILPPQPPRTAPARSRSRNGTPPATPATHASDATDGPSGTGQPREPRPTDRTASPGRTSEPTPESPPAPPAVPTEASVLTQLDAALEDLDRRPLAAREELSRLLLDGDLGTTDAALVREALSALNEQLVFGLRFEDGDSYVEAYRIRSGDALSQLPRQRGWKVGWRLLADVAGVRDPARLQVGQVVKGLRGPFHAVVTKRSYRLDVWMGDMTASPVYVTSFDVGLGSDDGTPVGRWTVRSKDVDPAWRNPETGTYYRRDDPENPIGERWIGIQGIDPANAGMQGFGIHGTIDEDSIGSDQSMGCVRLVHDDIVRLYDLLGDDSLIVIRTSDQDPVLPRR